MNVDVTDLTPVEEDPVLHEYFASLAQFGPRAGFEDRVMSRVWQPTPAWLRPIVRTVRGLTHPKRAWAIAGTLAVTSSVFVAIVVTLAIANWMHVETGWRLFSGTVVIGTWSVVVHWSAATLTFAARWFELLDVGGTTLAVIGCGITLVVLSSAWGLRRTMKRYDSERVALHAMR